MASHERVHSRRLDHPLSAAAVAGQQAAKEQMKERLLVEQRSRELMEAGVEGAANTFLKQLQLQQMYPGLHQSQQQQQRQQQQREREEMVIRQRKRRAEEEQVRLEEKGELEANVHERHTLAEQQRRQGIQLHQQRAAQSQLAQNNATQSSVQQQTHPQLYRFQNGERTRPVPPVQQSCPSNHQNFGCYPTERQWGVPYSFDHATGGVHVQGQHAQYSAPSPAQSLPQPHVIPLQGDIQQIPQEIERVIQQQLKPRPQLQHAMLLQQNEKPDAVEQQTRSQQRPKLQQPNVPVRFTQVQAQNGHDTYPQTLRRDINVSAPLAVGAVKTQQHDIEQSRQRQQGYPPVSEALSHMSPKEQSQLAAKAQRLTLMDCFYNSSSAGAVEHALNTASGGPVENIPDAPIGRRQSTDLPNVSLAPQEVEEVEEDEEEDEEDDEDYYEVVDEEDEEGDETEENAQQTRINEIKGNGEEHVGEAEENRREDDGKRQTTEDHLSEAQGADKSLVAPPSVSNKSLDPLSKQPGSLLNLSNASFGSAMDFSLALTLGSGVLKLQNEDADLLPQYYNKTGKRPRSRSSSGRKSSDSKSFNDGAGELGQPYYTPDPAAALNRWSSGGLKYNGKWSDNMSDILNAGIEGSGSMSASLSLLLPDLGVSRSLYASSVSPLGMTLTTPCASPHIATAYSNRGFQSPRNSSHMSIDKMS